MDFEITKDGVLTAYYGISDKMNIPEGVKYIDQYNFRSQNNFSIVYFPKSFLGYKPTNYGSHYVLDLNDPQAKVMKYGGNTVIDNLKVYPDDVHDYIIADYFKFKSLEAFEVSEDNPVYATKDGILYSKDFSKLIICPSKKQGKVVVDKKAATIMDNAFCNCPDVTEIELSPLQEYFDDHYDSIFDEYIPKTMRILGEGITSIFQGNSLKEIQKRSRLSNSVLIFPKIEANQYGTNKFYKYRLAMGYCVRPDLYSNEDAAKWNKFLKSQKEVMLAMARVCSCQEVVDYYNNLDKNDTKPTKAKKTEKKLKLTPRKATLLLEEKVLFGTVDEVKETLQACDSFEFTARALGLACRYGGLEKVKALISAKIDFDYSQVSDRGKAFYGTCLDRYDANYQLMVLIDYLREEYIGINKLLSVNDNREIDNVTLLPEEERIEIIKYLIKKLKYKQEDKEDLLYYAVLFKSFKIAQYLWDEGIRFGNKLDIIEGHHKGWLRKSFMDIAFYDNPESAILFAKLAKEEGSSLRVSPSTNLYQFYGNSEYNFYGNSELMSDLLEYAEIPSQTVNIIITNLIDDNNVDILNIIIEKGYLTKVSQLDKYIKYSTDNKSSEVTAVLLNYKNKLDGFNTNKFKL